MDGNFAVDHATEGSYAHVIMQEHLKKCSEYEHTVEHSWLIYTLTRKLLLVR